MPAQPTPEESMASAQPCRACTGPTRPFAKAQVLGHVDVTYHRCDDCGLVMAIDPTWLPEAYSDAIAALDVGLLDRCQILSNVTAMVLRAERLRGGTFLDWAGGYGTLTRMMRDRGFDFHHTDPMATNVFAGGHDVPDLAGRRYDLVTAFEVLEHLVDPAADLAEAAASTDRLLTTTHLAAGPRRPARRTGGTTRWSRASTSPSTRRDSLERLAERLGFDGVVTSSLVHLFHRGRVSPATRALLRSPGAAYATGLLASLADRRHSLLDADVDEVETAGRRARKRSDRRRRGLWRSAGRSTSRHEA